MKEKLFSGSLFSPTRSLSFPEDGKLLKSNIRDGLLRHLLSVFPEKLNKRTKALIGWMKPVGQIGWRQEAVLALVERVKIIQEDKLRKGFNNSGIWCVKNSSEDAGRMTLHLRAELLLQRSLV